MYQTILMLNLTLGDKDRDVTSSPNLALLVDSALRSFALAHPVDALLLVVLVVLAKVIPDLMDASLYTLILTLIVRMTVLRVMQDFQIYKYLEEVKVASVFQALWLLIGLVVLQVSALSTHAMDLGQELRLISRLGRIQ